MRSISALNFLMCGLTSISNCLNTWPIFCMVFVIDPAIILTRSFTSSSVMSSVSMPIFLSRKRAIDTLVSMGSCMVGV